MYCYTWVIEFLVILKLGEIPFFSTTSYLFILIVTHYMQGCYCASLEQEPGSLGAWEREVFLMKKRVQKLVYDGGKL